MLDRRNSANITHGVVTVHDVYGDAIVSARPVEVGIIGRGIGGSGFTVSRIIDPEGRRNGADAHDSLCARFAAQFAPAKIHVADIVVQPKTSAPSTFDKLDGLRWAILNGVWAFNFPYSEGSNTGIASMAEFADQRGCVWVAHYSFEHSSPGDMSFHAAPRPHPNVPVAFEYTDGPYNDDLLGVVCRSNHASYAGPMLMSALGLLKLLEPGLHHHEAVDLIFRTAERRSDDRRWLRVDKAVEEMLGPRSINVPTPETEQTYPRTLKKGESVVFKNPVTLEIKLPEGSEVIGDGVTIIESVK